MAATVALAVLGYAGSLAAGMGGTAGGAPPPLALAIAGAAGLGMVMGLAMGAGQAALSRGRLPFVPWTWRNAAGWALAMPAIFAGSSLAGADWPLWAIAATGAVSGSVAGALLALATAPVALRRGS